MRNKLVFVFAVVIALVAVVIPSSLISKASAASVPNINFGYPTGYYWLVSCSDINCSSSSNPIPNIPVLSGPGPSFLPSMKPLEKGMLAYIDGRTVGTNGDLWLKIDPNLSGFVNRSKNLWVDSIYVNPNSPDPAQGSYSVNSSKWIEINYFYHTVYGYEGSYKTITLSFSASSTLPNGSYEVYDKSTLVMAQNHSESQAYILFNPDLLNYKGSYSQIGGVIRLSPKDSRLLYSWIPNTPSFEMPVTVISNISNQ